VLLCKILGEISADIEHAEQLVDKINMRFVQSKGSPWNAFPIECTHINVSDYDESFSFSVFLV
jgi:hypothetical protein